MSEPTHTGRAARTQGPPSARPSYVEVARGEATPIPDEYGGLLDRVLAKASSAPSVVRDVTDKTGRKLREMADNSLGFMGAVGTFCVLVALVFFFAHGFLGWFPEREIVELRAENRRLQMKLADKDAELTRANTALLRALDGSDGDASGGEAQ